MEKTLVREFLAGEDARGRRLDAALAVLFPCLGLRGRRRLWKEYLVLADGIARSPAYRLRGGETIRLVPLSADAVQELPAACAEDPPRFLARRGSFFFFYKPGGLHTESLAGASTRSLAALLGQLVPEESGTLRLLGRLDQGSSGIVAAAGDEDAAQQWRRWENAGDVEKDYLAVLEGSLAGERLVRNALDPASARRTRVSEEDGPILRHTRIRPLACFQAGDAPEIMPGHPGEAYFTLAVCRIAKGARHQIRAHTAHAGHPLAGDALYGACGGSSFFLHHCRIQWPEGRLSCLPPWIATLPASVRAYAESCCGGTDSPHA